MLMIGWTTLATREEAKTLARKLVESRLVACAQIDGPIRSVYRWEEKVEASDEWRLTLKFSAAILTAVEKSVLAAHPYSTPEWIVIRAENVSEKYLSWVQANSST